MRSILSVIFSVLLLAGCVESPPQGFDLPKECGDKCEPVSDMNSFFDAVINSSARFSKCICLESGELEGDVLIGKPLYLIGKNDGSSKFKGIDRGIFIKADGTLVKNLSIVSGKKGITVSGAKDVELSNIKISNVPVEESAVRISGSEVSIKNLNLSNIKAGSLFGGRGIVVTDDSKVSVENSVIEKTDGTGLLINGLNIVSVKESSFSQCGFGGIWIQNGEEKSGSFIMENSLLKDNGPVGVQLLGDYNVEISGTKIEEIKKREINLEVVGDGIVVKNKSLSQRSSFTIKDVEIDGYERAGMIFDGVDGELLKGISIDSLKVTSDSGKFGIVVQNGEEEKSLREGIVENPFTENDLNLSEPLFIIETFQE